MKGMMSIKFIRYGLSNMSERNFLHPKNAINNSQQQISIVLPFEKIESKKKTQLNKKIAQGCTFNLKNSNAIITGFLNLGLQL